MVTTNGFATFPLAAIPFRRYISVFSLIILKLNAEKENDPIYLCVYKNM